MIKPILTLTSLFLLVSCLGGKSDDSTSDAISIINPTSGFALKGHFIDSPVEGIEYFSKSFSGITGKNGSFDYIKGEKISFKIGEIPLGTLEGQSIITPLSLELENNDEADLESNGTINRVKILISLDKDNNPDNGIQITEDTRKKIKLKKIDFTESDMRFEALLVEELKIPIKDIPTREESKSHFKKSLDKLPPLPPKKIIGVGADRMITLRWEKIKHATSYNVFISKNRSFFTAPILTKTSSLLLSELKNKTRYFIKITSVNRFGEGPDSKTFKLLTYRDHFSFFNLSKKEFKYYQEYAALLPRYQRYG